MHNHNNDVVRPQSLIHNEQMSTEFGTQLTNASDIQI